MAKEIFVAYGVDVDAVAGWLGSYGGEDSPRRHLARPVRRRGRHAAAARSCSTGTASRRRGSSPATRSRRSRRRPSWSSTPATRSACTATRHENPIAMTREQERPCSTSASTSSRRCAGRRPTGYVAPWWEFSNGHQRAPAQARDQVRPLAHAQGLPPVLRPRRRLLDEDRLLEARRGVDGAAPARRGDRPDRDPGQLVPRRPAADDVHQGGAQQPRLRQPAPPRADLARPVRLGLPRDTTTRCSR